MSAASIGRSGLGLGGGVGWGWWGGRGEVGRAGTFWAHTFSGHTFWGRCDNAG